MIIWKYLNFGAKTCQNITLNLMLIFCAKIQIFGCFWRVFFNFKFAVGMVILEIFSRQNLQKLHLKNLMLIFGGKFKYWKIDIFWVFFQFLWVAFFLIEFWMHFPSQYWIKVKSILGMTYDTQIFAKESLHATGFTCSQWLKITKKVAFSKIVKIDHFCIFNQF